MNIAQLIAADAVKHVLNGQNLTVALPIALAQFPQATPQQKSAGTDLSYGTLRYYFELRFYLTRLLKQPLSDARVQSLLLVALYQLQYDQAKPFTVVNQVVKAVSQLQQPVVKGWAKGLVNAVCRNYLRQQASLKQAASEDISALYAYPRWWVNRVKAQYPQDWQAIIETGNQHPPMTLRLNTSKSSATQYQSVLSEAGIQSTILSPEAIMLDKPVAVAKLPEFASGLVSVQDYGAQVAAHALDLAPGLTVLDACSAPGGKTTHCLQRADIELTALDHDEKRLDKVRQNLERLQLAANIQCGDASKQDWWDGQSFDRILADVPCSASGIVRRHVDMKCLRRADDIERFAKQQSKILANLWQMLSKGGKLLYVTCSIFDEENQRQIDQFLSQTDNAKQLPVQQLGSASFPGLLHQGNQLVPNQKHDGFFYALLQKW